MRQLGHLVGRAVAHAPAEVTDRAIDGGVAGLGVGELHVAAEEEPLSLELEEGDDRLEIHGRPGTGAVQRVQETAGIALTPDQSAVQVHRLETVVGGEHGAGVIEGVAHLAIDEIGALEHLVTRGADDGQADVAEVGFERLDVVAPEPDHAGTAGGERRQHLSIGRFEVRGGVEELGQPRVRHRRIERRAFVAKGGRDATHAVVRDRGVAVLAASAPPAEIRVGHQRPPGSDHALLHHPGQAPDVVLMRVGHDQEVQVERRLPPEQRPDLLRDRLVPRRRDVVAGMPAVDEHRAGPELAQERVTVFLGPDVEEVDTTDTA